VTVRGPRRQIEFWQHENLRFRHKLLENPRPGHNQVRVNPSDLEADTFNVVDVSPEDPAGAYVDFVATATEMKPVRVRLRNQPSAAFLVGKPVVVPAQVRVKGSSEVLASLPEVWTEEVDLANATQDVTLEVPIAERMDVDERIVGIQCSERVRVTVPIQPVVVTRPQTLDVWVRAPPGLAMRVDPPAVTVELVIEERDFKEPEILSKIAVYVEWPGAWARPKDGSTLLGPETVQVKVSAPARVQVRGVNNGPLPTVSVTGAQAGGLK
jgi:hypothetical protein